MQDSLAIVEIEITMTCSDELNMIQRVTPKTKQKYMHDTAMQEKTHTESTCMTAPQLVQESTTTNKNGAKED